MFTLSASAIALFVAIVAVSAVVQALTGFGFALCALALLACWMDVRDAAVLLCPAGLTVNALLFYRLRRQFRWSGLIPLLVASLVGLPFGTLLLFHASPRLLEGLLVALMAFAALQGFVNDRSRGERRLWHPIAAGVPCGFCGGVLSGAFGTGGPPVVSYLLNRQLNRFRYIASTQALLGIVSSVRLVQFIYLGRLTTEHASLVMFSIASVLIGSAVGITLLQRCSDRSARRAVLWFLLVGALGHAFRI